MNVLVKGDSMLPTLEDGAFYKLVLDKNIQKNDIIVYCKDGMIICHRVVDIIYSKSNLVFIKTRGDNCKNPDPYAVTLDMVIGKIIL